jgi:hypothetical protein
MSPGETKSWPVCIENFIRIDLIRESLNVGHDGRADIFLLEPGCRALQVQEPCPYRKLETADRDRESADIRSR